MGKPLATAELDRDRIVAMSAAIALNLAALFLFSIPGRMPVSLNRLDTAHAPLLTWVDPRGERRPSVASITRSETQPAPSHVPASTKRAAMSASAAVALSSPVIEGDVAEGPAIGGAEGAGMAAGFGSESDGTGHEASGAGLPFTGDARLRSIDAPEPPYPFLAERHSLEGSVYLKVLVGADGKVVSVVIAKSSGYPELDNAARRQVMRAWTFEPEIRGGKPVAASGMVVVNFKVKRV